MYGLKQYGEHSTYPSVASVNSNQVVLFVSFRYSVRVANRLERLQNEFLWGGTEDEIKFHLVNWARIWASVNSNQVVLFVFFHYFVGVANSLERLQNEFL
jgi:hypothetical protein